MCERTSYVGVHGGGAVALWAFTFSIKAGSYVAGFGVDSSSESCICSSGEDVEEG